MGHANSEAAAPTISRTCRGTPTPTVSANTTSSASAAASRRASSRTTSRVDGALERAAERGPDRHGRSQPILVRTRDDALGGLYRLLDGRILVALVERLRRSERDVRLVQTGFHEAVVATLVEDETGIDDARPAVDRSDDLLGPSHLRHPRRIDEADCLDARQPGVSQALDKLGANLGFEDLGIVLEPVARGDVADDDAALGHNTASLLSLAISSDEAEQSTVDLLVVAALVPRGRPPDLTRGLRELRHDARPYVLAELGIDVPYEHLRAQQCSSSKMSAIV